MTQEVIQGHSMAMQLSRKYGFQSYWQLCMLNTWLFHQHKEVMWLHQPFHCKENGIGHASCVQKCTVQPYPSTVLLCSKCKMTLNTSITMLGLLWFSDKGSWYLKTSPYVFLQAQLPETHYCLLQKGKCKLRSADTAAVSNEMSTLGCALQHPRVLPDSV